MSDGRPVSQGVCPSLRPTPPPDTISLFIYSLLGLPAFQGLWTNTANLHLCFLLFQTIPWRRRRIITHTVLVPNKPLVFICPPPHQPISPHVFLYMRILSIYSYIYYKNLHPSQKYCDILYSLALRARTGNRNQSTLLFSSCKPLLFISHLTHSYNEPGIGKKFSPGPS